MSNFNCDRCSLPQIDSPRGYIAGCAHHPPDERQIVEISFDGETWPQRARHDGAGFYTSVFYKLEGQYVHPVMWREIA